MLDATASVETDSTPADPGLDKAQSSPDQEAEQNLQAEQAESVAEASDTADAETTPTETATRRRTRAFAHTRPSTPFSTSFVSGSRSARRDPTASRRESRSMCARFGPTTDLVRRWCAGADDLRPCRAVHATPNVGSQGVMVP